MSKSSAVTRRNCVCRRCRISHIENCGSCFGFGVYPSGPGQFVPIAASEVHDGTYPLNWLPCPECRSTPAGAPKNGIPLSGT
jgi:hypothetical protein